jgi:branched-chain amino acid transport system substrate-binding protein
MDFFVSRHHFLDALTLPLEKHLKRLADTVQQILARKGASQEAIEKAEAEEKARREAKEAEEKAKKEEEEARAKREAEEARKTREAKEKRAEPVGVGVPLLKRWWLWSGAAVVLVALICLLVFLPRGTEEVSPPGEEVSPPGEEVLPEDGGLSPLPPLLTKDAILIGASRSLTGANAIFEESCFGPIYRMWVDEVNAAGGIYVADYGKKLPIELLVYDDTSDTDMMTALTEHLILEDQVDILFSACSTAFISAQVPIANQYGYVLITAEGSNPDIRDMLPGLPYVFVTLPFSDNYQLPVLADMLAAKGAETAYITYVDDSHGMEYSGIAGIEFAKVGIDILGSVSVPLFLEDYVPIIEAAKVANPDVFCCFCYPWMILPATAESMALGFNPDAWIGGPGANFGFYPFSFGDDVNAVNGVLCFAAANQKTSPQFADLYGKLEELIGAGNLDYWGHPYYMSVVQIWQEAIEATGTLDQDVLRDYIATTTVNTILGPTWFTLFGDGGGLLAYECHPGEIGQWQDGVCEIVGGGDWPSTLLTADFIYPKPDWP